jgi:hypothetical protein
MRTQQKLVNLPYILNSFLYRLVTAYCVLIDVPDTALMDIHFLLEISLVPYRKFFVQLKLHTWFSEWDA